MTLNEINFLKSSFSEFFSNILQFFPLNIVTCRDRSRVSLVAFYQHRLDTPFSILPSYLFLFSPSSLPQAPFLFPPRFFSIFLRKNAPRQCFLQTIEKNNRPLRQLRLVFFPQTGLAWENRCPSNGATSGGKRGKKETRVAERGLRV